MKRMSLSEEHAAHLYELAHDNFQDCYECQYIKKRLEKFLGPSLVRRIKKQLKDNPYDSKIN